MHDPRVNTTHDERGRPTGEILVEHDVIAARLLHPLARVPHAQRKGIGKLPANLGILVALLEHIHKARDRPARDPASCGFHP